ncbi:cytochrome c biogenesis protein transmembrane region [Haloferax mucosum ATCC BAA-1512]|uniref:Cytochrome c biogenesis protein transmembrane region n=1 Tax=Haloferax mucosum ATCC BAA-1512 TaxID=662479 RepID=M0I412_9EURY|nr:cytochrome c biogenesis protein CcdA [Haloferax mucosum]ELZ90139.1 cytochrome c biogenesis protein transmembrane region [Haloferax mucosum ATCC BAA-1512]
MLSDLAPRLFELFVLGVGTPLTAACALPLYPGFLAYLARQSSRGASASDSTRGLPIAALGGLVTVGAVSFMLVVGVVFSLLLEISLTVVVEIVSPIAFGVLFLVSLALLADAKLFARLPTLEPPETRHPALSAFSYGFFFGAIVLPCNPGFIALFFARVPVLFDTAAESLLGFFAFGLGIGAPLLAFSLVSERYSRRVTRWFARHTTAINRVTGAVMLVVSVYYLLVVFDVLGVASQLENIYGIVR